MAMKLHFITFSADDYSFRELIHSLSQWLKIFNDRRLTENIYFLYLYK